MRESIPLAFRCFDTTSCRRDGPTRRTLSGTENSDDEAEDDPTRTGVVVPGAATADAGGASFRVRREKGEGAKAAAPTRTGERSSAAVTGIFIALVCDSGVGW